VAIPVTGPLMWLEQRQAFQHKMGLDTQTLSVCFNPSFHPLDKLSFSYGFLNSPVPTF